ncbi:MAG: peptidoglycan-associated lipoprotein Pal [Candidatus Krumholzibacteriia bacterium]
MKSGRTEYKSWQLAVLSAALLIVGLGLMAGCGGKQEVETEPAPEAPPVQEDVDRPMVPEEEEIDDGTALRDYSVEQPQDYGVEDVFFAFDSSSLTAEAMSTLSQNARILREVGTTVVVEGHCDERGTVEYNLALGERRANSVRDYLVSLGVPGGQLRTVSYGESRPFAAGHDETAWALNRRAHFTRP